MRVLRFVKAFVVVFVFTVVACSRQPSTQTQPAPAPPSVASPQADRLPAAELTSKLQAGFSAIDSAAQEVTAESPDAKTLAERLGGDPTKLFEWVRDETYWVPYRGALRGDAGVVLDRLGNSLDRSFLLYMLLRHAGHEVRLAHAMLSSEQGQNALRRVRPSVSAKVPAGGNTSIPRDAIESFARRHNLDAAELHSSVERQLAEARRLIDEAARRVSDQAGLLQPNAPGGGPEEIAEMLAWQLEGIRDHWWVQWKRGAEWVDLDVLLPDAAPGTRLTESSEVLQPSSLNDLPEALLHSVTLAVVIEVRDGGTLREIPVFSHRLVPAALIGEPIVLRHAAPKWPKDLDLSARRGGIERLKATILAQQEWIPVLSLGSTSVFQLAFTTTGEVRPTTQSALAQGTEALGGRVRDILRAPGGDPSQPQLTPQASAAQDRLTAEWIEYEIQSPGQAPRKIRRQIFDLIGPAIRSSGSPGGVQVSEEARLQRGLALQGETGILPLSAQVSPDFALQQAARAMLAMRDLMTDALQAGSLATSGGMTERVGRLSSTSATLYGLALARTVLSPVRGKVYIHTPNILSLHKYLSLQGDRFVLVSSFDIAANHIAIRPGAEGTARTIRLQQGVVDTNAEALLPLPGRKLASAGDLLAKHRGSSDWVTIRDRNDREWQRLNLPPDARARMTQDVAEGHVVVAPRRALAVDGGGGIAWWKIDPRTGQTLGIGETGWGQGGTEYTLTTEEAVAYTVVAGALGDFLICAWLHQDLPEGTRAALKCFAIGICAMLGAAAGLALVTFSAGVALPVAASALGVVCGWVANHF